MKIAIIGHKRIPSNEGGIEKGVEQHAVRMVQRGNDVTVYNRGGHNVFGKEFDGKKLREYKGIKIVTVPTVKGAACVPIYSFLATIHAAFSRYDCVSFRASGSCAMIPLAKLFGLRVVASLHGIDSQRDKWGGFASKYLEFGERMAATKADVCLVLSKNMKEYIDTKYGVNSILFANGVDTGRTAKATKANHWHYEFSGLDTYDEDAAVINYTVKEVPVEKYTADQNGYDFTNKHVPYTRTVNVTKNWKNDTAVNRPASITVRLKADGNEVETKNVSPDSDGKWTVDFENLPVNKNGKEIKYTVTEDEVQKYNVEYSGNMDDGMVITNTRVNDPAPKVVKKHGPKTGDTMYPLVHGVILLSSILALMVIIIRRKSRRA